MSYNNQGVWNRNAYFWEGSDFDHCLGHPAPNGEYHHHVNPKCLYDDTDSLHHSPIIGYAFDGFPVYGAYAYASTAGTGAIKRMRSSYSTTTTASRTSGPTVSTNYPTGCFIEDYKFTQGSGDLDARNGRFCVTPDYPGGIYAYFVTIDAHTLPVFPYTFFQSYNGIVQSGNTGPGGGHNTITENVTTYTPTPSGIRQQEILNVDIFPNPFAEILSVVIDPMNANNFSLELTDLNGRIVMSAKNLQPAVQYSYDLNGISPGIYCLKLSSGAYSRIGKVLKLN
jgi:hypothetical protein